MSIEEKAKAYDKAYKKVAVRFGFNIADEIFPELKESEDERVRKEIIDFIYDKTDTYELREKSNSWLEKQGDKDKLIQELGEYKVKYTQEVLEKHLKTINKDDERLRKTTIAFLKDFAEQGYENAVECIDWLEKHEQKPTDKVEPKFNFKVSQWIVATGKCVYLIAKIDGFNVTLVDTNGDEYVFDTSSLNDAHEWTIQDAKDGDVLEFGDHGRLVTGILSFVNKTTGKVDVSCLLEGDKFKIGVFYNLDTVKPHPATKEQRSLLFQKMREAEYEWDAEKKELKRIEQKPAWSEDSSKELSFSLQIQAYLNTASDELYAKGKPLYSERRLEDIHKCMLMWQKLHNAYFYQKSAWSEEDEDRLDIIFERIERGLIVDKDDIDRLKSLRPQSTWKPSDEQMLSLERASNSLVSKEDTLILGKLLEQLKKLREE